MSEKPKFELHHAAEQAGCSPLIDPFSVVVFGDKSQYRVSVLRPVPVTAEDLETYRGVLQPHLRSGLLQLKTPDGRSVDPTSLEALTKPRVAATLVQPVMDSVKRDKNEGKGHVFPEHVGGEAQATSNIAASAVAAFGPATTEDVTEEEVHEIPRATTPTNTFNPSRNNKGRGR